MQDQEGNQREFKWQAYRAASPVEVEDECARLTKVNLGASFAQVYETVYRMMFWQSLNLPPPDIVEVAIVGTGLVSVLFVATAAYVLAIGVD